MAKRVQTPVGFHADGVLDVYSLSSCVNDDFADYIRYWKHSIGYLIHQKSFKRLRTTITFNSKEHRSFITKYTRRSSTGRIGSLTNRRRRFLQTFFCLPKRPLRGSMWSPFSLAVHLSVHLFHVTVWRVRLARTSTACWSRLKMLTRKSVSEASTKPNPVLTASSRSILSLGPRDHSCRKIAISLIDQRSKRVIDSMTMSAPVPE
jgi:hypothetical protein